MPCTTQYKCLTPESPDYPAPLRELHNKPETLFIRGNDALLQTTGFAIVGTRRNTPYGKQQTVRFTQGLVSYGLTIVSGLALGIDALAHKATLECGGKTIAVLGSGIDEITPHQHRSLAEQILKRGGLIVSEYPPGEPVHRGHFPARNRIISGLSIGTLIIEAPQKSGALITARHAFEQNRDVFALPADLARSTFQGNHFLLANERARLVRHPEDILNHLSHEPQLMLKPLLKKERTPRLSTRAQRTLWNALSEQPLPVEMLIQKTGLSPSEIIIALAYLELKGHIHDVGYGRYAKKHPP